MSGLTDLCLPDGRSMASPRDGLEYQPLLKVDDQLVLPPDLEATLERHNFPSRPTALSQVEARFRHIRPTVTLEGSNAASSFGDSVSVAAGRSGPSDAVSDGGLLGSRRTSLDVVMFASMFHYVREAAGSVQLVVMRCGALQHPCSVIYHTEDNSAKAGQKYKNTKGKIEFLPGEEMRSVKIRILEDDSFDVNLDFKVVLEDPIGCQLGDHKTCRVVVLDDDVFPTNVYREQILGGGSELDAYGVRLLMSFFRLVFMRIPIVRWRTIVILLLDQCFNLNYLLQIWLNVYLVDVVLAVHNNDSINQLWVPHQRLPTAMLVALAFIVPKAFLSWVEYMKDADFAVAGRIVVHLKCNLFRKYLYYSARAHSQVSAQELTNAMEDDIDELVRKGYMMVFDIVQQTVKVGVMLYFLARRRPSSAVPLIIYPIAMALVLNTRCETTLMLKHHLRDAEKHTMACLRESCDDVNLIKEYNMRAAVVTRYEKSIKGQAAPNEAYGDYDFRTMLVMPWITNFAIAIFMIAGANFVLQDTLSLGAYLATIGVYRDAGTLFSDFYVHFKNLYGVIGPLMRVVRLLNLETDVQASMDQANERFEGMVSALKAEERRRKQFAMPPRSTSRFDMLHIKLVHASLVHDRGGPTHPALQDISVEVQQGKVVAILGPHGSGKLSMLKLLTGFVKPKHGKVHVPTHLRTLCVPNVPEVFRNGNFFENLTFGIRVEDLDKTRLIKLCGAVGLGEHSMALLEGEMKETEEEALKNTQIGVPWYDQLSSTELLKMHITRAFALNPEVLLFHRPVDEMEADHAARLLDMFRQHADNRGIFTTPGRRQVARPRTVFFSSGEDRERADSSTDVADVVWHLSAHGFRCEPGAYASGEQTQKSDNKISNSWSRKVKHLKLTLDREKDTHTATKAELDTHKIELQKAREQNEEMRGALHDVFVQAKRAMRDAKHFETELANHMQEEKGWSRLACGERQMPQIPMGLSRTLNNLVSAIESRTAGRTPLDRREPYYQAESSLDTTMDGGTSCTTSSVQRNPACLDVTDGFAQLVDQLRHSHDAEVQTLHAKLQLLHTELAELRASAKGCQSFDSN